MMQNRWKKMNWITGILLVITLFLQILAREVDGFAQVYSETVYRLLVDTVGRVISLLPFSLVEIGLYALIVGALAGLIWLVR